MLHNSQHYWQMWMDSFRALCNSWVRLLAGADVPEKLLKRYVGFAEGMEWPPHQTVGHWDTIHVAYNRTIGETVSSLRRRV